MEILKIIKQQLLLNQEEKIKESTKNFFKEKVISYGVKTKTVSQISKKYFNKIKKDLKKQEIFNLCESLFKSGYLEEAFIACNWSYYLKNQYEKNDFYIFEKWVKKYITNWAVCDTLCNHTIGEIIFKYPEFLKNIKKWTKSKNRWVKRASAVSLIVPARNGYFLKEVFEISNLLFFDKDDLVQKGYGWLLKVASNKHQKQVYEYVIKNKHNMPRTSLRYAIEKMPKNLKKIAMQK